MEIGTVGVVGAGVMGVGVAQSLAQSECMVILVDLNDEILERARRQIKENLRLQALFKSGAAALNTKAVLDRIAYSQDFQVLEKADSVVPKLARAACKG